MILHPSVNEVLTRQKLLANAIQKGRVSQEVGNYTAPGWVYVYKDRGTPSLAYANAGNYIDEMSSDGALAYVVTTSEEDRDGDIVRPMGCQLQNYSKNPIVFFGHQEWEIPIGVCRAPDGRITVFPEENRVVDVVYFDLEDPDADFVYQKCRRKILNATSIAFVPVEAWKRDDVRKARQHSANEAQAGWYFNTWDKTEVSIVGVPSNPGAVGIQKDLSGACRDVFDREKRSMSPKLRKAWKPYCAEEKGCWNGWCPLPGDTRDIGGGVVLKAVAKGNKEVANRISAEMGWSVVRVGTTSIRFRLNGQSIDPTTDHMLSSLGVRGARTQQEGDEVVVTALAFPSKQEKSADPDPEMDFAAQVRKAGEELSTHTDPAPMPGYGQVFRGPNNELWYVGGDGDEDGFADLVQEKLGQFGDVKYEAESFPPKDEGWEQLYPKQKMWVKNKATIIKERKLQPGQRIQGTYNLPSGVGLGINTVNFSGTVQGVHMDTARGGFGQATIKLDQPIEVRSGDTRTSIMLMVNNKGEFQPDNWVQLKRLVSKSLEVRQLGSAWYVYRDGHNFLGPYSSKEEAENKMRQSESIDIKNKNACLCNDCAKGKTCLCSKSENTMETKASDVTCPRCKGEGTITISSQEQQCPRCNGAGVIFAAAKNTKKPEEKRKKALSQSDGRVGGYVVPAGSIQDQGTEFLDDPESGGWVSCVTCHGDGNCSDCGGTGDFGGENCTECSGLGECGTCSGEGHEAKSVKKTYSTKSSPIQVLAALYSHAKAEAAYLDEIDEETKGSLADYRRQQVEERMNMLKYQFSRAAGPDDDIEKLCKTFEDEHDKGMTSIGPDQTMEPGEAGLVEQGHIPPEPETKTMKRKTKQSQVAANGAYIENNKDTSTELDSGAAPFNKAAPGTEEWAEEEVQEPEHKAAGAPVWTTERKNGRWYLTNGISNWWGEDENGFSTEAEAVQAGKSKNPNMKIQTQDGRTKADDMSVVVAEDNEVVEEKQEDNEVEEKAGSGMCMCGADLSDDGKCPSCEPATEEKAGGKFGNEYSCGSCGSKFSGLDMKPGEAKCPQCGSTDVQRNKKTDESVEEKQDEVLEEKLGPLAAATIGTGVGSIIADKDSDPATEEILERYQQPKSNKWVTRKHLVPRSLLKFLKYRKSADGKKYLVHAKAVSPDEFNRRVNALQRARDNGEISDEEFKRRIQALHTDAYPELAKLADNEIKKLTTKLAGAIDDLKSLVQSKNMPRELKIGIKHVADSIWYVGKALTDKGKEQKTGGSGSELSDTGKEQKNGGKGSELKDKGEQQGKTPTKSVNRISAAVEQKILETEAKLRRHGVLNGAA